MSGHKRSTSPSRDCNGDAEALQRRIVLLEESSSKAWSERTDLESRIESLEREQAAASRSAAQAFESGATRVTELAVAVAEMPSALELYTALGHLRGLEDLQERGSGQRLPLQQLLSLLDGRLLAVEERFNEVREQLEAKAESRDQDRLADALGQSCRDHTATLRACRQDFAVLEQNCRDVAQAVTHANQEVSRLDRCCAESQRSVAKWEQDMGDLEQKWSRRLWGYSESSARPSSARRPAGRPVSGCIANRGVDCEGEGADKRMWKPWPNNGVVVRAQPVDIQQADDLARRICDGGPQRPPGAPPSALRDREGFRAEEQPRSPNSLLYWQCT